MVRPDDEIPKRAIATLTVMLQQAKDNAFDGERKAERGSAAAKAGRNYARRAAQAAIQRNPQDLRRLR